MVFEYKALVTKIVDGDTLDLLIDLGFSTYTKERIRLARINADEMNSKEVVKKEKAVEAKEFLHEMLYNKNIVVRTISKDKYGRYIAEVYINNISVSDIMLERGLVEKY